MSLLIDSCNSIVRVCMWELTVLGMPADEPRPDVWVNKAWDNEDDKARAMGTESVLYAAREMLRAERCDWRVVLRCWGMARIYLDRARGGLSSVRDAMYTIQNELEKRVGER